MNSSLAAEPIHPPTHIYACTSYIHLWMNGWVDKWMDLYQSIHPTTHACMHVCIQKRMHARLQCTCILTYRNKHKNTHKHIHIKATLPYDLSVWYILEQSSGHKPTTHTIQDSTSFTLHTLSKILSLPSAIITNHPAESTFIILLNYYSYLPTSLTVNTRNCTRQPPDSYVFAWIWMVQ
jgi:hypothetical protein